MFGWAKISPTRGLTGILKRGKLKPGEAVNPKKLTLGKRIGPASQLGFFILVYH